MTYKAPSKILGNRIGLTLHDDWGLGFHEILQKQLLPTGAVRDGYDRGLVESIIADHQWTDQYFGFDRYHIAFGMISQFNRDDIEYFVNTSFYNRSFAHLDKIERVCEKLNIRGLGWIPSPKTLNKIERFITTHIQDRNQTFHH